MKNLTGSEKQVKWAEGIRKGFEKILVTMKDAAEKVANPTIEVIERKDPLRGTVTRHEVEKTGLTVEHEVALSASKAWWPEYAGREGVVDTEKRIDFYRDTISNLEKALNTECDAVYWIERRVK